MWAVVWGRVGTHGILRECSGGPREGAERIEPDLTAEK